MIGLLLLLLRDDLAAACFLTRLCSLLRRLLGAGHHELIGFAVDCGNLLGFGSYWSRRFAAFTCASASPIARANF